MVGANLAHRLVQDGHHVSTLVRGDGVPLRLVPVEGQIRRLKADLTDGEAVRAAVAAAAPEVVFHLASTPFNPPPEAARHVAVNVLGTMHLMEALAPFPGTRVVFTGTAAQYGDGDALHENGPDRPSTVLGATKCCAATLVHTYGRLHGLTTVEARLFAPYGPWERPQRLIPYTILCGLRGEPVRLGDGRQERDYLHVDDVVSALMRTMDAPLPSGLRLNVCSGTGVAIRTVAERILTLMGNPSELILKTSPARPDEIWKLSGDNAAARRHLNWEPRITLDDGLRSTVEWFRSHQAMAENLT